MVLAVVANFWCFKSNNQQDSVHPTGITGEGQCPGNDGTHEHDEHVIV